MGRKTATRVGIAIALVALFVSCGSVEKQVELAVGGHSIAVEIAATPEARQQGLMHREELAADEGMLFVFPDERPRSFWMKNTPLPLSIAYIDRQGRILEIYDMEPFSLAPVPSRFSAKFALEVNQGVFEELGIGLGDRVEIPPLDAE